MKTLEQVVKNCAMSLEPLGGKRLDIIELEEENAKRERKLIADLQGISERNGKLAWALVAALMVLIATNLWLVLFRGDLSSAKSAIGLLGVSAAGCVKWLHALWAEKSATELLLRLAVDMKGEALREVIKVLAKRSLSGVGKAK